MFANPAENVARALLVTVFVAAFVEAREVGHSLLRSKIDRLVLTQATVAVIDQCRLCSVISNYSTPGPFPFGGLQP